MRQFYLEYRGQERLQPLVGEISWAKHLIVMAKCKDPLEREFYIRMTRKFGWSKNVLIHQIENQSYEKTLLGQTNFDQALTPAQRTQAKLAVKDEYTCDFLARKRGQALDVGVPTSSARVNVYIQSLTPSSPLGQQRAGVEEVRENHS